MSQAKERPILFSGPMVRAILDGDKAVTRRAVKMTDLLQVCLEPQEGERKLKAANKLCPLGRPGDRLWVRETHKISTGKVGDSQACVRYQADGDYQAKVLPQPEAIGPRTFDRTRPSIHMPRWASRILLEITDVRVERLQDISEQQALAEGVMSAERDIDPDGNGYSPVELFGGLWVKLNGMDSWSANPWVWVVEFKRVEP